MKRTRLLAFLLAALFALTACGSGGSGTETTAAPATEAAATTAAAAAEATTAAAAGDATEKQTEAATTAGATTAAATAAATTAATVKEPDAPVNVAGASAVGDTDIQVAAVEREFYKFRMWYGYDWYSPDPWGGDKISAHWRDMFNIEVDQSAPDTNPMEVLMLMVAADDMPDAIWMDRNEQNMAIARMGLFVPVNDMKKMVDNTWYDDNVMQQTQIFYQIDGVNYIVPNWNRIGEIGVRGYATGGNNCWMVTTKIWEAVGSPEIRTYEDLYNYAVAVRDAGLTNYLGAPVIPMATDDGSAFGMNFVNAIYRSYGGVIDQRWFSILPDGTYGCNFRNPIWRDSVLEANRWYRDGLFPVTNLTNSSDEFLATINTGRAGLMYYDHSQDSSNRFRRILREGDPGNSIEIIVIEEGGDSYLYPPANNLSPARMTHEQQSTLGWNGTFITTSAEHPERIFEWATWMLTPVGNIEMMYGPRGGLWDSLDSEGHPIMKTYPAQLSAEEYADYGLWQWTLNGSPHTDPTKFAVNNSAPPQYQDWVETIQYTLFSPYRMITDEFALIVQSIDPGSDLAIRRKQIEDHFEEIIPQVIMAGSRADAESMLEELLAFAEGLGVAEIEAKYNERWKYNVDVQGLTIFTPPGTP